VCNLYSITKGQQAIRQFTGAMHDRTGNMPPLPGIYPDYAAPIVRNTADGRELMMARWGMPSPLFALQGKKSDPGVTNVRNVGSPHWRRWLGVENRCVVAFTGRGARLSSHNRGSPAVDTLENCFCVVVESGQGRPSFR
jgi:putative SOS response-associated peptidase YedK